MGDFEWRRKTEVNDVGRARGRHGRWGRSIKVNGRSYVGHRVEGYQGGRGNNLEFGAMRGRKLKGGSEGRVEYAKIGALVVDEIGLRGAGLAIT